MKSKKKVSRPAVVYFRLSAKEQRISHFHIEAQEAAVQAFCEANGYQILSSYQDVDSGKNSAKPELDAALEAAKATKALLIISKLGGLCRDVEFIFNLRDSGVEFKALDIPEASTMTLGIMASIAQAEREFLSNRTLAALALLKARGVKLGPHTDNLDKEARAKGKVVMRANALTYHSGNIKLAVAYRQMGWTLQHIAQQLNDAGARTRQGKLFIPKQVSRLLELARSTRKPNPLKG